MATRTLSIEATTHGRCRVEDAVAGPARALIVGFHGYAQTAEEHLDDLRRIPHAQRYCLAAVQALHPFYRRSSGELGASWMTRQDRALAIADNVAYVARAVDAIRSSLQGAGDAAAGAPPLVYLGFSQGASMAWRAAVLGGRRCAGIVALAGDMPADLTAEDLSELPAALIAQGRSDGWYDDQKRQADEERLRASGATAPQILVFDGGHEWHADFYSALGEYLEAIGTPPQR